MTKDRRHSIIAISLFSFYLLSFLFEGQVLHTIIKRFDISIQNIFLYAIIANFLGLFICGFLINNQKNAKDVMVFSTITCILFIMPFFFLPSLLWYISLIISSFAAGLYVAAWGFYFKNYTSSNEKIKTAADVLVLSNILMIMINMAAIHLSPYIALASSVIILFISLYFQMQLPKVQVIDKDNEITGNFEAASQRNFINAFILLFIFITIITVNSGFMYQVINPAFEHLKWLVSWYWAIPYIIAIYIMKNLPKKINHNYMLYVAIAMIGFSFLAFMALGRSAGSYLIVNTLMLGACGVYDLFWWSILGEMLDYHDNPAKIFGMGLSANVLGIFIGSLIGNIGDDINARYRTTIIAFVVVFVTLMILPILHKYLLNLLRNHAFLSTFYKMEEVKQNKNIRFLIELGKLTQRESQIAELLLKGRTYKMIAEELYLSENTVKTHVKNIYSKLQVKSKVELMGLIIDKD